MVKILLLAAIATVLSLHTCEALKCYYCIDSCETSKAAQRTCGDNIGSSQEAVCTTEIMKETKSPSVAIRRCLIVKKGEDPDCPPNSMCTTCKSELCNAAPSVSSNMAVVGVITAYFVTKFLY